MEAGEEIYVTEVSASTFKSRYWLPEGTQVFQYPGTLQNGGERLELLARDFPDTNNLGMITYPYIVVDGLRYNDAAPWVTEPDGSGPLLERINNIDYADDAANWQAGSSLVVVKDIQDESYFKAYPNPASTTLSIRFYDNFTGRLYLVNILGQTLLSKQIDHSYSYSLDISRLTPGFYFIKFEGGGMMRSLKLVVQ
ncbi:MAG: T9SS type A sorting domain-containing protein [Bacteroidetes bacterium]|nr:T9SS type A sorting domain-containing protein [Bacteroidota bacterium]